MDPLQLEQLEGNHPPRFVISERDGSAYYLHRDELVQVALATDGVPTFEDLGDGDFGGGAVDWDRGIENDDTRGRLKQIADDLRSGRGFVNDDIYIEV